MNKSTIRILSLIFLFSFIVNIQVLAQGGISIAYPNGGESLAVGTSVNILFGSFQVTNVNIEYSINSGANWTVITTSYPAATGTYAWTVPGNLSTTCKIRITDSDSASVIATSASDFAIVAPSAPVLSDPGDKATGILTNKTFSWGAITSSTSYKIQIGTDNTFDTTIINQSVASATYTAAGLVNGTKYYWRVNATVSGITTDWATYNTFFTKLTTPVLTLPTDNIIGSTLAPSFSWSAVTGANRYTFDISTDSTFSSLNGNSSIFTSPVTGQLATPLDHGTVYYWRVKATDNISGNSGDYSVIRRFTAIPFAPQLTLPEINSFGIGTSNTFTWGAVNGASSYMIQISKDNSFATTVINQVVTIPSFGGNGLTNGTKYYWRVNATVGGNTTDWSNYRAFTVKLITPLLVLPNNNAAGVSITPSFTWSGITGTGIDHYTFDISADSSFSILNTNSTSSIVGAATGPLGTSLSYNTTYYWRVRGTTIAGNFGDYSTVRIFTTLPAAPNLTSPGNNTNNYSYLKVTYSWDPIAGATSYDLQVCKDTGFVTTSYGKTGITGTTYTSTYYLDTVTQYYWRVKANIGTATSSYSSVFTFTTDAPAQYILDASVRIYLDHANGRISQITFNNGSGNQLLNIPENDKAANKFGLGRINSETGTKLVSWVESLGNNSGTFSFVYDNPLYGSKTVTLVWDASGVSVNINLALTANLQAVLNATWTPGGDAGPIHDYILLDTAGKYIAKYPITYQAGTAPVFSGSTYLAAIFDDRYDEFFGFKSTSPVTTIVAHGLSFGPQFTYPKSTSPQSINIDFAIKSKAAFFNWTGKKYIAITSPFTATNWVNNSASSITWENYGVTSHVDINLSTDGGNTYAPENKLATDIANNGSWAGTLPSMSVLPQTNCLVSVSEHSGIGASGLSSPISIVKGVTTLFTMPTNLTGSPTDTIVVPFSIIPGSGASIYAYDIRLYYDKDVLSMKSFNIMSAGLAGWITGATDNPANGYIQIGGLKNNGTGAPITNAMNPAGIIVFNIKSTARVGIQTQLKVNNDKLSASDVNAAKLLVAGNDGKITIYGKSSGFLRYILNKKPINFSKAVHYNDSDNGIDLDSSSGFVNNNGQFIFSNMKPGSNVIIAPINTRSYPDTIIKAVDAVDAALAFAGREGGPTTLSALQLLAADINGDGKVNSTDAYAILRISTGDLHPSDIDPSLKNWIFVDSTYKFTTSNWSLAPQSISYNPIDTVKTNQSFWGMLRGDVDGSYNPPAYQSMGKELFVNTPYDSTAVLISVPADNYVRPGDTLYLPINAALHGRMLGAFNLSVEMNNSLIKYSGQCTFGTAIPQNTGWTMSSYSDDKGKINIAATDLIGDLDPIKADGSLIVLTFIADKNAKPGDLSDVQLSGFSIADSKLTHLTVSSNDGKVKVSDETVPGQNTAVTDYSLFQNYPNPFNPSTTINYTLPKESRVVIEVFNTVGQRIGVLVDGTQSTGYHSVIWNAKNFASGIYFYTIKASSISDATGYKAVKKLMLLK